MSPRSSLSPASGGRNAGLNGLPRFGVNETDGLFRAFEIQPVVLAKPKEFSNDVICKSEPARGRTGRWRHFRHAGACPDRNGSARPAQPGARRCQVGRGRGVPPLLWRVSPAIPKLRPALSSPLLWRVLSPALLSVLWLRLWRR